MTGRNPYAAPKAQVRDTTGPTHGALIDALDVSDRWKAKFHVIDKAGGPGLPRLHQLPRSERNSVGFNVGAYVLTVFYYLAKGMWRKGIAYLSISLAVIFALIMLFDALGWQSAERALPFVVGAWYAIRADVDYYRKNVLGDDGFF